MRSCTTVKRIDADSELTLGERILMFRDCCLVCWNNCIVHHNDGEHIFLTFKKRLFDNIVGNSIGVEYDFFFEIDALRVFVQTETKGWESDWGTGAWFESMLPICEAEYIYRDFFDFVDSSGTYEYEFVRVCNTEHTKEYLIPYQAAAFRVRGAIK